MCYSSFVHVFVKVDRVTSGIDDGFGHAELKLPTTVADEGPPSESVLKQVFPGTTSLL